MTQWIIAAVAAFALSATATAGQEDWTDLMTGTPDKDFYTENYGDPVLVSMRCRDGNYTRENAHNCISGGGHGLNYDGYMLGDFARYTSIERLQGLIDGLDSRSSMMDAALSGRIDSLEAAFLMRGAAIDAALSELRAEIADVERKSVARGIALAASVDIQGPAPGASNRFSVGTAAYSDELAVSFNYTRRQENVDVGLSVATTGDGALLGKASMGFSW